jgi:hypothetical protein
MKTIFKLILILFIFSSSFSLKAQSDKIRIILKQPPPNMMGVANLWDLSLENTTNENLTVYLIGTAIEEKDGLIIEGKTKEFTIKPGRSNYKYNDFSSAEVKYNNGKYKEIILRTGNAPEGNYTICVTAFGESGNEVGRENCITQNVQQMGSVILISPGDGSELDMKQPVLFNWTPIVPKPSGTVTYRLKVWQLMQGQNSTQAMRSNQPIFSKDIDNITQAAVTSIITGPCKPPFLCDFIWAIEITSKDGINSTRSEPFTFRITDDTISRASNDPDWENLCTVNCERYGILFVVGQNTTHNAWMLSCTFTDMVYYLNSGFNVTPSMISYHQIINPHGLYCNNMGHTISNTGGIWEITETNPNINGGIINLSQAPIPCDFFTLANLWNAQNPGSGVENSCRECEIAEGWESGWEGESEWIAWQIEHEENRPPSDDYTIPVIVHDGRNISVTIRDKKQADDLKNMGLVISNEKPANLNKCPCGKNIWAGDKESTARICDYLKTLYGTAQRHPEIVIYDSDRNVLATSRKSKNGEINVFIDEARLLELSKKEIDSLKISNEEFIKSIRDYLTTGDVKSYQPGQPSWGEPTISKNCWTVFCNNPNHPAGCGWRECSP